MPRSRPVVACWITLLGLLAASGCSSPKAQRHKVLASTTTIATTTTIAPTTTRAVSTTAPTTTLAPPNPNGPVVSAEGAELAAPTPAAAPIAIPADCMAMAAAGQTVTCGHGEGATAGLLWIVRDGPGAAKTVEIYRTANEQGTLALTASDSDGTSWQSVTAFSADIGGPDGSEIIVAYRLAGTGAQLHVDVVGGDAQVQFHRELDQGRVEATDGVYKDWSAKFGPDDPNCCPSTFAAETVDFIGEAWRVGRSNDVDPSAVPAGQVP